MNRLKRICLRCVTVLSWYVMILFSLAIWIVVPPSRMPFNIYDLYGLTNIVTQPTCFKGDNPTVIDVTLASNPRRYIVDLNASFGLSDHHNIIGAATRRFAPKQQPGKIFYRSYKHFNELDFTNDIEVAPFHVAYIFDDVDDTAWFHATLIKDVMDSHALIKTKIIKKESVPFMNSKLRKAQYKRNMQGINSDGLAKNTGMKIDVRETMSWRFGSSR